MSLRVALLLDRGFCFAWEATLISRMMASNDAELSAVITTPPGASPGSPGFWLNVYARLDAKLFRGSPDAFRTSSVEEAAAGIPTVALPRIDGCDPETLQTALGTLDLDVILNLTDGQDTSRLIAFPRLGVWSLRVGAEGRVKNRAAFLEMVEKIPILEASLEMDPRDGGGRRILRRSLSRMDRLSLNRSRNIAMWRCAALVMRELATRTREGEQEYLSNIENRSAPPQVTGLSSYVPPRGWASFAAVVRQGWRIVRRVIDKVFFLEQWVIALDFGAALGTPFQAYRRITPPKDRFWADPHVVRHGDEWYVFFEELPFDTGKGRLAVGKVNENGALADATVILEKPYHLSYPFVFRWEGAYYMIPETSQNKTIELYECTRFPDEWSLKQVLMRDVRAVDATLVFHEGTWWMFANVAEHEGHETLDELFLFYADDFRSDAWTPHPLNPVVSDIRNARPAGKTFEYQGALIRPSQDCSDGYGGATNFNRIVTLNKHEYEETRLQSVSPSWDRRLIGLHTISVEDGLTVIDLCVKRWKFGT